MRISKYFNRPRTGVIFHSDKWKYEICDIVKSVFYACLIVALSAGMISIFMYALLTPDY